MKRSLRVSLASAVACVAILPTAVSAQEVSDNYVGVGAATGGFVVNGRVVVGEDLSLRPALITDVEFNDDSEFSVFLPVTYDFESPFKTLDIEPFAGVGLGGSNRDDEGDIGAILTAGADYDLNDRLVLNSSVVWSLFDGDSTDFMAGLGYRF